MSLHSTLEETIKEWNTWFPFDYKWRKKYNVPFGSKQHFETSFFHMMYDLEEEKFINNLIRKVQAEEEGEIWEDTEGNKNEIVRMSEKEIDKEFENLNHTKF